MLKVVTPEELTKTISKRLRIGKKKAREYADTVMEIFGYDDTVCDNIPNDIRKLFYILEGKRILTTKREIFSLPNNNGRHWRIFYWSLNV